FPLPESAGGDVRNLPGSGDNDSIWMYTGAPIWTAPDGRKYTVLFAPLIIDLDGKVNVNVHGHVRGRDQAGNITHTSTQGWWPWEVSPQSALNQTANGAYEWPTLFLGTPGPDGGLVLTGRYGFDVGSAVPKPTSTLTNNTAPGGRAPHVYSQVDFDACVSL